MEDFQTRTLGRTGFKVCRLGVATNYGAPAAAFEEAFDHGVNYFYWSPGLHKAEMNQAIRNLCGRGRRDDLIVVLQTYARIGLIGEPIFRRRLRALGLENADVLILGWHNRPPSRALMDRALALKEKGLVRFLGMSGHNRTLFPELMKTGQFDVFHVRYNAAHRGAEEQVFPYLTDHDRPGLVTYTATRWAALLNPKKMPPGQPPPRASDCYRFVLSHQAVDACLCGPKNIDQMREALQTLELGPLSDEDMTRMKRIGDHVHQSARRF